MAFSRIGRPQAALAMGLAALAAVAMATPAEAGVAFYQGTAGLAAFNAAAGNPGIGIDFENLSGDLTGQTINGVKFINPGSNNTMDVVAANSTFTTGGFDGVIDASTNRLFATSGRNVLSPGGSALVPGPDVRQVDTIELIFDTGMPAFGLDVLFQSFDLSPGVFIDVFSATRELGSYIMTGNGAPGGAPGESVFFGVTSTDDLIRGLIISDGDNNNIFPDANLGYDTFRFGPSDAPAGAPEPATWAMLLAGFGMVGAIARRYPGRRLNRAATA
jgi:hypothetical protein